MKMKIPHIVPLSAQAVNLLKTLQLITGHGTMLFPGERDEVSAAYNHATYLKQRTKLMQDWSDYLDTCITGKVLPFKRITG